MNILIINAHSSKNKGDAGIILSIIDSLEKYIPECNIKIKSKFPEIDKYAYGKVVNESIHNFTSNMKPGRFNKLLIIIKLLICFFIKNNKDGDYEWADIVVSCGGGFLLSHGYSAGTLQHLVQIKTAINYKRKVIVYSQSIGPFNNKLMKLLTKITLDNVHMIFVREAISRNILKDLGVSAPVELVPDSAFSMKSTESEKVNNLIKTIAESNKDKPLVGITVRDWNFPNMNKPMYFRNKYIESMQKLILFLEKNLECKVLLMPQVLGPNNFNDDRVISREILSGITSKAKLIDIDLNPRELKYFYSKMDMFIGTRMHSNIFALSNKIPTVAINYEHKTQGIMESLNLSKYVIDINDITPESIIEKASLCWEHKEQLKEVLESDIDDVVINSQKPALHIRNIGPN
ncbi:polysaccharide pyruvyl transferase family protein [Halobacillus rhizosphaerae]|uniref:polysaccharide pyruvyl transferase family protein n=1 Tax=Halobacillus rhizosphaerae TaxID=3064889 RepID=UPI00398AD656